MVNAFTSYEEFAKAYRATFAKMMSYSPNEVGSTVYVEKLSELADAYPIWAEQAESEE